MATKTELENELKELKKANRKLATENAELRKEITHLELQAGQGNSASVVRPAQG